MPAARCLWLYGLHGYRQYTQYRIRRLIEPFSNSISGILYELGGDRCATVHREFISGFPFLCRKETRELHEVEYTTSVRHAILADMCEDSVSGPLFYAVVFLNKRFADLLKAFI